MVKATGKGDSSRAAGAGAVRGDRVDGVVTGDGSGDATYRKWMGWLSERVSVERAMPVSLASREWKLTRMAALLEALGSPQQHVRCLHVAGSKGKGSVVEMAAAALSGCGYTTGIYTSPHLVDLRERIRINQQMIPHGEFSRHCETVSSAMGRIAAEHGEATFFEILTAIALLHYQEQAVDVAVIEVGLGGRLDATNLVRPMVTAVSAIQLEHTQILGDTVGKIAREKAGIFKPGVPAITFQQAPEVMEVFAEVARTVGASLEVLGREIEFSHRFEHSPELGPHARVCVGDERDGFMHLPVPLRGEHQALNAGLALAMLLRLRDHGFQTPELKVAQGLARTPTAGRLEVVSRSPRIVVDGAHTPDSVSALMRTLGSTQRYDSLVVVFGCASDKDLAGMVSALGRGADKVVFTRSANNPRSVDPRELGRKYLEATGRTAQLARSVGEALDLARRAVGRDDLICVTGSYYVAGEAKSWVARHVAPPGGARGSGGSGTP